MATNRDPDAPLRRAPKRQEAHRIDAFTWTVPSRTEKQADGKALQRIVTIEDGPHGPILTCDCPAGYLGVRSGACWHVRVVAGKLRDLAAQAPGDD